MTATLPLTSSGSATTLTPSRVNWSTTCWLCTTGPTVSTSPCSRATSSSVLSALFTPKQKPVSSVFLICIGIVTVHTAVALRQKVGDTAHDDVSGPIPGFSSRMALDIRQCERLADVHDDLRSIEDVGDALELEPDLLGS